MLKRYQYLMNSSCMYYFITEYTLSLCALLSFMNVLHDDNKYFFFIIPIVSKVTD